MALRNFVLAVRDQLVLLIRDQSVLLNERIFVGLLQVLDLLVEFVALVLQVGLLCEQFSRRRPSFGPVPFRIRPGLVRSAAEARWAATAFWMPSSRSFRTDSSLGGELLLFVGDRDEFVALGLDDLQQFGRHRAVVRPLDPLPYIVMSLA